jgi:hypothetical protein
MNIPLQVYVTRHKRSYLVKFASDIQLTDKIKSQTTRVWDSDLRGWVMPALSVMNVIAFYKGRKDIFFHFDPDTKKKFLAEVEKAKIKEEEKVKHYFETMEKYKEWVAYKQVLEDTADDLPIPGTIREGITPFPHQLVAAYLLDKVKCGLLSLEMGLGKAGDVDSQILTPTGWVRMGDIQPGDDVINSNGKTSKVTGVFPQGVKDMYRVTFSDGSSTECCEEHLWNVNTTIRNFRNHPHLTMSLREIMDGGLKFKNGNNRWYIPIVKPVHFTEQQELSLDPYLLGCLLADGYLGNTIAMVCHDDEIINEMTKRLPVGVSIRTKKTEKLTHYFIGDGSTKRNSLKTSLRSMNLLGKLANAKSIPQEYLFSTIDNRLELLQGLMDCDGYVAKDGCIQYYTVSEQLMNDVKHLVQSLGGICRVKTKVGKYKKDDVVVECQLCYIITINLPQDIIPFKLGRKIERLNTKKKYHPLRAITNIELVGQKEAQCISVDADDHLYVVNDFIVTHNTLCSIIYVEMQEYIDGKVIVITPNSLKYNYKYEVEKFTHSKAYVFRNLKSKKGKAEELAAIAEAKYVIFNYEYMAQAPKPKDKKKVKSGKKYFDPQEKFYSLGLTNIWGVICDESHRLKNQESNTFINFEETFGKAPTKVFLSGTPAPNRIEELYSIIHMLSPEQFPNKADYFTKYCGLENYGMGWVPAPGKVPDYEGVYKAMAPFTYRKRKTDVLKDLPDKTYSTIVIEPDEADLKAYFRVEEEIYEKLTPRQLDNPNLGLVVMLEFRRFLSTLKGKYLQPVFNRMLDEDEKFVVFDFFKESLGTLHDVYKDISVLHTGDVKDTQERAAMVKQFQENEKTKIFFGSNSTCGAGLTLTAANKLFQMTQPFSVGENDQLADRIHRIGQKNACTIYIPIVNHTLDWAIFRMVENKRSGLVKAIDNEDYKSQVMRVLYEQMKKNIDSRRQ